MTKVTGEESIKYKSELLRKSDLRKLRNRFPDKKIVFTYGTFDLLHSGHVTFLINAKLFGDILVVGISTDKSKHESGKKYLPLIHQKNRAEVFDYFDFVDNTVYVDDRDLSGVLKALKPDIFYTITRDWKSHLRKPHEEKIVKKYKGKIIKARPSKPFFSSNDLVNNIADLKIKEIIEYFFGKVKIDLSKGDWQQKKFSGLKTNARDESIKLDEQTSKLGLFGQKFASKIIHEKDLGKIMEKLGKENKKVVLTSGACDLIHSGHARFYAIGRAQGDKLILAIPTDRVIRKQKGRGRPIISEKSRMELMTFFDFIDYVFLFDGENINDLIYKYKPAVFFTVQEEWNEFDNSPLHKKMEKWGGKIVSVPPQAKGLSSSKMIRKAAGIRVRQVFKEVLKEAEKEAGLKD